MPTDKGRAGSDFTGAVVKRQNFSDDEIGDLRIAGNGVVVAAVKMDIFQDARARGILRVNRAAGIGDGRVALVEICGLTDVRRQGSIRDADAVHLHGHFDGDASSFKPARQ